MVADPKQPHRRTRSESIEQPSDDAAPPEPEHPGQTGPSLAETPDHGIGFEEEEPPGEGGPS